LRLLSWIDINTSVKLVASAVFRFHRRVNIQGHRNMAKMTILKAPSLLAFMLALVAADAFAKDTQFWNLTANTITSLQLSSPGKNEWGRNQADNDRDHTVDHDERLKITDTEAGIYDVRFTDKSGRTCVVPNVQIKAGAIFMIEEKQLTGCDK
jgi:hypothetical protein